MNRILVLLRHGQSEWNLKNGFFFLNLVVPPNTSATVYLPTSDFSKIQESGKGIGDDNGVRFVRTEKGSVILEVTSGTFHFRSPM